MPNSSIFLPMLVQISLTLVMFILLGRRKTYAFKYGKVDKRKTALDNQAWPDSVIKVSNNIANQFQTPVIFYVLCGMFYVTNQVTMVVYILAWVYSITRVMHAFVHVNSNYIPARFGLFTVGVICLIIMTVIAFMKLPISY
ncbi:MAG: MAPEG family protein [Kangiellaceae bacterium]